MQWINSQEELTIDAVLTQKGESAGGNVSIQLSAMRFSTTFDCLRHQLHEMSDSSPSLDRNEAPFCVLLEPAPCPPACRLPFAFHPRALMQPMDNFEYGVRQRQRQRHVGRARRHNLKF